MRRISWLLRRLAGRSRYRADLRAEIDSAVEEANKAVSKAESIRKFAILAEDWTEEGGQLTPSLKVKRSVVMRELRDDVSALYRSGPGHLS